MAPSTPFQPPPANRAGKPTVPDWVPPPITQEKHDFASLTSIDLSLLDSDDPAVVDDLIKQVKRAIREEGFLFLENYGVSLEQVIGSVPAIVLLAHPVLVAPAICARPVHVQQHQRSGQRATVVRA